MCIKFPALYNLPRKRGGRRVFVKVLFYLPLCLLAANLYAQPLYIRQLNATHPSVEDREEALKQVKEHKDDIAIRDDLDKKLPTFHKRLDEKVTEGETFCQSCHLPLPHTKKLRSRAFLNMHSRFIACATCHFRPEGIGFDFRWLDYQTWQETNPEKPFRTGTEIDNAQPIDGNLKIAPFYGGQPAVPDKKSPFAQDIRRQWQQGDLEQKARLKARLHAPLEKEGPDCTECHTSNQPLLDLTALGASARQKDLIEYHRIPSFFSRYQSDNEKLKIIGILR